MQPHRYSRLQSLFDQFATCFNDADTVIVSDVYAAGEQPIEGVDRDGLVAAIRAHGHRQAIPLEKPEDLPKLVKGNRAARRLRLVPGCRKHHAMGLRAAGATGELMRRLVTTPFPPHSPCSRERGRRLFASTTADETIHSLSRVAGRAREGALMFPDITPALRAECPTCADGCRPTKSWRLTWFRVGGPAQVFFQPADEEDLSYFLSLLAPEAPVLVVGLGSNLIVRDGGVPAS